MADNPLGTFLSTSAEWHALGWGVYKGLTSRPLKTPAVPDNPDVEAEPHYYRGGYIGGTILRVLLLVLLLYLGVSTGVVGVA